MKLSRLAMLSMPLVTLLATPAFADISGGGGGHGGGGCSIGGADVASSLAGLGVFALGYVGFAARRRFTRKEK
jgi:hypothetical protein